jgi:hypothetical protein
MKVTHSHLVGALQAGTNGAAEQSTGADGPQRRLLGLLFTFYAVGRSSLGAFGAKNLEKYAVLDRDRRVGSCSPCR